MKESDKATSNPNVSAKDRALGKDRITSKRKRYAKEYLTNNEKEDVIIPKKSEDNKDRIHKESE